MRRGGDVRVRWTAGTGGNGGLLADGKRGWIEVVSVTIKGQCPSSSSTTSHGASDRLATRSSASSGRSCNT
jgi:hypothetical protein